MSDFAAAKAVDDRFNAKVNALFDDEIVSVGAMNIQPGSSAATYTATSSSTWVLSAAVTVTSSQTATLTAGSYTLTLPNGQNVTVTSGSFVLGNVSSTADDTIVSVTSGTLTVSTGASALGTSITVSSGRVKLTTFSSTTGKALLPVHLVIAGEACSDTTATIAGSSYMDSAKVNTDVSMGGKSIIKYLTVSSDTDITSQTAVILVVKNIGTSSATITYTGSTIAVLASGASKVYIQTASSSFAPLNL